MTSPASLLDQFDARTHHHHDFCLRLETLLRQLLGEQNIQVHSVTSRVKTRDSLASKIGKKGGIYRDITEITDIVGLRIVTFFADQVSEVAKLIEEQFFIDRENSSDKRDSLDTDRFGYLSVHYIVGLTEPRCLLKENKSFASAKAEIQIRSILQHAWAEIEHDIGYKSVGDVPRSVRRQFARLAGLLELADEEFVKIRSDIDSYSKAVSAGILENPKSVALDLVSLEKFAKSEPMVAYLDDVIAKHLGWVLRSNDYDLAGDVSKLEFFGLRTVADVRAALSKHYEAIGLLAERWRRTPDEFDDPTDDTIERGICLFYLCHVLAGYTQDIHKAETYYAQFGIGNSPEEIAQDVIEFALTNKSS